MVRTYRKQILYICLAVASLFGFLVFTNPNSLQIGFLAIPILLIGFVSYQITSLAVGLFGFSPDKQRRKRSISVISATVITGTMIFQSIGALGIGEIVLLVLFCSLAIFYTVKLI